MVWGVSTDPDRSYHFTKTTFPFEVNLPFRPKKKIVVFQVPCQKKTGSVGRLYFFFFFYFFFFLLTVQNSSFPLLQKSTGNVIRLWILVICTMVDLL